MYRIILLLFISICFSYCSDPVEQEVTLVGQWKLDKVCFSNGASSCDKENLQDAGSDEVFTFNADGTLSLRTGNTECSGTYEFDSNEILSLNSEDTSCNFSNTTYRVFDLLANSVTINPPCREACIKTYVRLN